MLRLTATRAASICFVSSHARSRHCNPYSPNATVLPRDAIPARLPRCILRYFTLAGCNGIKFLRYSKIVQVFDGAGDAPSVGRGAVFSFFVSPLQPQHLMP